MGGRRQLISCDQAVVCKTQPTNDGASTSPGIDVLDAASIEQ
jgi:hypothetical protein